MKHQVMNPYMPLSEHVPDGEPHVFGNRIYVFGSHDMENGSEFCELDYVVWSAPLDDLSDWSSGGVIYRKDQDPYNQDRLPMYAPDVVQGPDGRFYLFYCVKFIDGIHVAVCDTPDGQYKFYGRVQYEDGRVMKENQPYDPSVICTEDGNFLYFGFAPCMIHIPRYEGQDLKGGSVLQLADDMLTVVSGPKVILPSLKYGSGTDFEGNEYFEAPSVRYIQRHYYLVYSSVHTHQLCYAVSDHPMSDFTFGGVIVSNGDVGYRNRLEADKLNSVGNNHGGLVCVNDQWYIFYHRHTGLTQYNRQACAEPVYFDQNGHIPQVTITTSGINKKPLEVSGKTLNASYCCNLSNGSMGALSSLGRTNQEVDFPYLAGADGEYFVTNIKEGTLIGYKYLNLTEIGHLSVECRGDGNGVLEIYSGELNGTFTPSKKVGKIQLQTSEEWTFRGTEVEFTEEDRELYFIYHGTGSISINNIRFEHNKSL